MIGVPREPVEGPRSPISTAGAMAALILTAITGIFTGTFFVEKKDFILEQGNA